MFKSHSHNQFSQHHSINSANYGKRFIFRYKNPNSQYMGDEDMENIYNPYEQGGEERNSQIQISDRISEEVNSEINAVMHGHQYMSGFLTVAHLSDEERLKLQEKLKNIYQDINNNYRQLDRSANQLEQIYTKLFHENILTKYEIKLIQGISFAEEFQNLLEKYTSAPAGRKPLLSLDQANELIKAPDADEYKNRVNALKAATTINEKQKADLLKYGPKTEADQKNEVDKIFVKILERDKNTKFSTNYYSRITQLQGNLNQLTVSLANKIDAYNQEVEKINQSLAAIYQNAKLKIEQNHKIRELERELGIPLQKGRKLCAEDWSWDPANPDNVGPRADKIDVEITDINFENPDIIPGEKLLQNYPSIEPVVHFKYHDPISDQNIERNLSASAFRRYANSVNLSEKIDNLKALEDALGMPGKIQVGQIFETTQTVIEENGNKKDEPLKVKIESIVNNQIILDQVVDIEPARPYAGQYLPTRGKKMNLDQFAKWIRSTDTVPQINDLNEINDQLAQFHKDICQEFKIDPNDFLPINLTETPPIPIKSYDENQESHVITSVTPQEITFDDGSKKSPALFLRDVKKNYYGGVSADKRQEVISKNFHKEGKEDESIEGEIKDEIIAEAYQREKASLKNKETKAKKSFDFLGPFKAVYKHMIADANFISIKDFFEIFGSDPLKHIIHEIKEKREMSKNKVGSQVHKGIPGMHHLADEYTQKVTSKTQEKVKNRAEWMKENLKEKDVLEHLYHAHDMIEMMACLQVLAEKGLLREDDEKLHHVLNHLIRPVNYPETAQIPKELWGQRIQIDPKLHNKVPVVEQIKLLMNLGLFEGAFSRIFGTSENKFREKESSTNSRLHSYEYEGEGIGKELQKRIYAFTNGDPVDEAEFSGLLLGAISRDEVSEEQGFLLFLSAWGARSKNDPHKTLLSYSKMYPFIGNLRDNGLYLFFALKHPKHDENGNVIKGPDGKPVRDHLRINDFTYLYNTFAKPDVEANREKLLKKGISPDSPDFAEIYNAGANMIHWIMRDVTTNPDVIQRLQDKANTQPPAIFHYVGPVQADTNDIDNVLRRGVGGRDQANVAKTWYEGYSTNFMARTVKMNEALALPDTDEAKQEKDRIVRLFSDSLRSFSYFDAILSNKIKIDQNYTRFQPSDLDIAIRSDKTRKVNDFAEETRRYLLQFSRKLADRSGNSRLSYLANLIFGPRVNRDLVKEEAEFRDLLVKEIKRFGDDDLAGLIKLSEDVFKSANVKGLSGAQTTREEDEKLNRAAEAQAAA